jgi:lambda repressor-like predicted transcriptional regulator
MGQEEKREEKHRRQSRKATVSKERTGKRRDEKIDVRLSLFLWRMSAAPATIPQTAGNKDERQYNLLRHWHRSDRLAPATSAVVQLASTSLEIGVSCSTLFPSSPRSSCTALRLVATFLIPPSPHSSAVNNRKKRVRKTDCTRRK